MLSNILGKNFSPKFLKNQQRLHKTFPKSIEFRTANLKELTNVNRKFYVIKDEPITSQNANNSCPTHTENGEHILSLQLFDNGQKVNIGPLIQKKIFHPEIQFLFKTDQNKNSSKSPIQLPIPQHPGTKPIFIMIMMTSMKTEFQFRKN